VIFSHQNDPAGNAGHSALRVRRRLSPWSRALRRALAGLAIVLLARAPWAAAGEATAPVADTDPVDGDEPIDADRPHIGTGPRLVDPRDVQIELGGIFSGLGPGQTYASPMLARVGVTDRIEARAGFDGVTGIRTGASWKTGAGNAQLGAKVRLAGRAEPWLSVMPTVTLGVASPEKQLGTGDTDVALAWLAGRRIGDRWHVEANYVLASVGAGEHAGRFAQHAWTSAAVYSVTPRLSAYGEAAWWSKIEPEGGAAALTDFGAIYAVTPRVLVDAGAAVGLSRDAPAYSVFAGLSFAVRARRPGGTAPSSAPARR
jgi:hypothetical protein